MSVRDSVIANDTSLIVMVVDDHADAQRIISLILFTNQKIDKLG